METATAQRKREHLDINLSARVDSALTSGFERLQLVHCALPEIDLADVRTESDLLGCPLRVPVVISAMTGGIVEGQRINRLLAEAAEWFGCGMGVGSQRIALEQPEMARYFDVRRYAPTATLFANLGARQLSYGYGVDQCRRAVAMIEANALVLHLNPLQEALQENGNTEFSGLLKRIEQVCATLEAPVIVKEIGFGISGPVARRLRDAGVAAIDIGGAGGTSWSAVEGRRAGSEARSRLAMAFRDWGIPTARSLRMVRTATPDMPVIASGGIRTGLDIAKALALGATAAGLAGPLLRAAAHGADELELTLQTIVSELQLAMFCTGSRRTADLRLAEMMDREAFDMGDCNPPPDAER